MAGYCALPYQTNDKFIEEMLSKSEKKIQYILCNDKIYSLTLTDHLKIEERGNSQIYRSTVSADVVLENKKKLMKLFSITKNLLDKIQIYQSLFPETNQICNHEMIAIFKSLCFHYLNNLKD